VVASPRGLTDEEGSSAYTGSRPVVLTSESSRPLTRYMPALENRAQAGKRTSASKFFNKVATVPDGCDPIEYVETGARSEHKEGDDLLQSQTDNNSAEHPWRFRQPWIID
jgi:hypothetical protein